MYGKGERTWLVSNKWSSHHLNHLNDELTFLKLLDLWGTKCQTKKFGNHRQNEVRCRLIRNVFLSRHTTSSLRSLSSVTLFRIRWLKSEVLEYLFSGRWSTTLLYIKVNLINVNRKFTDTPIFIGYKRILISGSIKLIQIFIGILIHH